MAKLQWLPRGSDTFERRRRECDRLGHRGIFVQPLEGDRAAPVRVVFEHDVLDVKLGLRELVGVLDRIRTVMGYGRWRYGWNSLVWPLIAFGLLILSENGNRRAKNYQRGGEHLLH